MVSQDLSISLKKLSPVLRESLSDGDVVQPLELGSPPSRDLPVSPTQSPTLISTHDEEERTAHSLLPLPQVLQEEGLDLGVQVEAIRPFIQGNPSHQHRMDQLSADCLALQRSLEVSGLCCGSQRAPESDPPGAFPLVSSFIPANSSFSFSLPLSPSSFTQQTILSASCVPGSVLGPEEGAA